MPPARLDSVAAPARELAARFEAYSDWRRRLSARISALHEWLAQQDLADAQIDLKVQQLLERLHQDKLVVAFVAEFSRGKSELINAIFFADFGQRLLPSSAGRTTMCPTELLFDASRAPSIRLLPIETRLRDATVAEFKNYADEWVTIPLDLSSADRMTEALSRVSQVKRVPVALARKYGLFEDEGFLSALESEGEGAVDIPCWRHAVINFPHPLLQQGLVILDTPGLNAIGTEPELTLNLLPNAHAVLFILAADAGVTKTDLEVWNKHLAGEDEATRAGRIVILNKIDGLWDELRTERDVDAEIGRQVGSSADLLGIPAAQVFAVSAQKALLAKVNGDDALLAKSRLPGLEDALSRKLIPAKRDIVGAATQSEVRSLAAGVRALLDARQNGIAEQLTELRALRGKNQDVVEHMMDRVRQEKELFERGLQRFTALRTVFSQQTNELFDVIGLDALRANAARTRRHVEGSPFTKGVRSAMSEFFATIRHDFAEAGRRSAEIHDMMQAMYARFAKEQGLERYTPPPFSMLKYQKEVDRLERAYNQHFNTLWNMVSKAKFALMKRFFETIASRAKHVYDIANRDLDSWLRALMSPLETQVKEHHLQLRRRLDSIKRIHRASGELEDRVAELVAQEEALAAQARSLAREVGAIDAIIRNPDGLPLAANA
ncbi:MAG TPA: dynamin family protein [Casimicrobiaceae bacterium]|nr:dynamin family protein [Casimicrobiaceae bacterium]